MKTVYGLGCLLLLSAFSLLVRAQSLTDLTLRELLSHASSADIDLLSSDCLDAKFVPSAQRHYVSMACHLSPSAEETFVFSNDGNFAGALYGWELAYLPNDDIVYHNSQVHFAPTHSLGISIYDPATQTDKKIYPPVPFQPVRQDFIARVAAAYKARGHEWFAIHNNPENPELFDSALLERVTTDPVQKSISFSVQYGDPENANDPLPFKETVHVICAPFDSLSALHCIETLQR